MNLKHAFAFLLLICIGSIPLKSRAVGIEFNHGALNSIYPDAVTRSVTSIHLSRDRCSLRETMTLCGMMPMLIFMYTMQ